MKEHDIRPEALARRYYELSAADAERCFPAGIVRHDLPCVACGGTAVVPAFSKNGFGYGSCAACGSLFQTPRPGIAAFEAFYRDSESSNYWSDVFFPAVAEVRRERIFLPRVERLAELAGPSLPPTATVIDVGAGYGIFLDEWRKARPADRLIAIEPSAHLAGECRAKGFETVEDIVENVAGFEDKADLVVCFEVLEHVYQPVEFMATLCALARPGGLVFISTLGVDGFDIQTLWDKSNAVFPPHHINFLSVAGFARLFERVGLVEVEITTPGQLDVDIVCNAAKADPTLLDGQRFLARLIGDDALASNFQTFLSDNRLSSHCWIIGRRPVEAVRC